MPPPEIDKWLCRAGLMSRSDARAAVESQRVRINNLLVTTSRTLVPDGAVVSVDEQVVVPARRLVFIMHKPRGVMSTRRDRFNRPTVFDFLDPTLPWLAPVGRLDFDSEGLLLFTNDPFLNEALCAPTSGVDKTYLVSCSGMVSDEAVGRLRSGVRLVGRDQPTQPAMVRVVERTSRSTTLEIAIHEGKKRQIRRMVRAIDSEVHRLIRVKVGPLELGSLAPGASRELAEAEIAALQQAIGANPRPSSD